MEWPILPPNLTRYLATGLALALSTCFHLVFLLNHADARPFPDFSCYSPHSLRVTPPQYINNLPMQPKAINSEGFTSHISKQPGLERLSNHSNLQDVCRGEPADLSSRSRKRDAHFQSGGRVMMGKLGSMPPSCVKRCNGCTPCEAVQVPVGQRRKRIGLLEYYPEAWRCKCKNKLYNPGA
eukprot:c7257_g1_i1 orf=328-870(+)